MQHNKGREENNFPIRKFLMRQLGKKKSKTGTQGQKTIGSKLSTESRVGAKRIFVGDSWAFGWGGRKEKGIP